MNSNWAQAVSIIVLLLLGMIFGLTPLLAVVVLVWLLGFWYGYATRGDP